MANKRRIFLDEKMLRDVAERGWTDLEIADHFQVDPDTLHKHYSAVIDSAKQSGNRKLKDDLWRRGRGGSFKKKNEDGSETLMHTKSSDRLFIHLLDRRLGPVKQETKHDGKIEVVITDLRSKKVLPG